MKTQEQFDAEAKLAAISESKEKKKPLSLTIISIGLYVLIVLALGTLGHGTSLRHLFFSVLGLADFIWIGFGPYVGVGAFCFGLWLFLKGLITRNENETATGVLPILFGAALFALTLPVHMKMEKESALNRAQYELAHPDDQPDDQPEQE
jgi:hypothetical protein